jgi:hypothetical protein
VDDAAKDRDAIKRAMEELDRRYARCFSTPYWASSSWDRQRVLEESQKEYDRAKD